MQLSRQKHERKRPQLNMASMIDVVFLLLIFFMCTSSFARPEKSLPSPIPKVGVPGPPKPDQLDPVRLRVLMLATGVTVTCDDQPCGSTEELMGMLRARRALGEPPVIIEGQPAVPFGEMVAVLDACHRAGLYRVAFSPRGLEP